MIFRKILQIFFEYFLLTEITEDMFQPYSALLFDIDYNV